MGSSRRAMSRHCLIVFDGEGDASRAGLSMRCATTLHGALGHVFVDFFIIKCIICFVIIGGEPGTRLRRAMTPVRVGLFDN
jgi:hypothetical protein